MNRHSHTFTTDARKSETAAGARKLAAALIAYAEAEERAPCSRGADRALHAACVAAENFTDDGDFYALRDALQCEHGWGDDGFPDQGDYGEPYRIGGFAHWETRP